MVSYPSLMTVLPSNRHGPQEYPTSQKEPGLAGYQIDHEGLHRSSSDGQLQFHHTVDRVPNSARATSQGELEPQNHYLPRRRRIAKKVDTEPERHLLTRESCFGPVGCVPL